MHSVKKIRMNSLSVNVLVAYVIGAVLSILLIVIIAITIVVSRGDLLSGIDLANTAREMADDLRFDAKGVPIGFEVDHFDIEDNFDREKFFDSLKQEAAYRVLDATGRVVLSSVTSVVIWPEAGPAGSLERGRFEFEHAGVAMRGATESVVRNGSVWYVQFAVSKRFWQRMYGAFALPFAAIGIISFSLVLLFVFGPIVYVVLRYALKPLRLASDSAAAISPRSLNARLQTRAVPREIAPLVESFNRVLDRLELGYRNQQEFLAMAAHELKTPLALIRRQIEQLAPSAQRLMLLQDLGHMSRQVQQLLRLAEASETQNYRPTLVEMHEVMYEVADFLQRLADTAQVRLEFPERTVDLCWQADRGATFTLLKNLLENAIQHAPAGTRVYLEVSDGHLSVRDWGPSVTQDELPMIFTRFWRGEHRRDHGAGLGLAICQEIAQAHGWTLSAQQASPGLRVVVSRPAADAQPASRRG